MLKSMTGFGIATYEDEQIRITAEIKTLNAKQADVNIRLPKSYSAQEITWKNLLIDRLERGRISLVINQEYKQQDSKQVEVNQTLFKAYYDMLANVMQTTGAHTDLFPLIVKLPGVLQELAEPSSEDTVAKKITDVIQEAIEQCDHNRKEEGMILAQKLAGYLQRIQESLAAIETLDTKRIDTVRAKLVDKLNSLKTELPIDENRLEQELIYYIERMDMTEEKVRLDKHLQYFEQVMQDEASAGKKLGFVAQEMGREINTLGAKAYDATIQKQVVLMKDELEKIKEQLQNML